MVEVPERRVLRDQQQHEERDRVVEDLSHWRIERSRRSRLRVRVRRSSPRAIAVGERANRLDVLELRRDGVRVHRRDRCWRRDERRQREPIGDVVGALDDQVPQHLVVRVARRRGPRRAASCSARATICAFSAASARSRTSARRVGADARAHLHRRPRRMQRLRRVALGREIEQQLESAVPAPVPHARRAALAEIETSPACWSRLSASRTPCRLVSAPRSAAARTAAHRPPRSARRGCPRAAASGSDSRPYWLDQSSRQVIPVVNFGGHPHPRTRVTPGEKLRRLALGCADAQACRLVPRPAPHRHRPLGRRLRRLRRAVGRRRRASSSTTSTCRARSPSAPTTCSRSASRSSPATPRASSSRSRTAACSTPPTARTIERGRRRDQEVARGARRRRPVRRGRARLQGRQDHLRADPVPQGAPATSTPPRSRRWPRTRSSSTARAASRSRSAATSSTGRRPSRAAPARSSASSSRRSCCS